MGESAKVKARRTHDLDAIDRREFLAILRGSTAAFRPLKLHEPWD